MVLSDCKKPGMAGGDIPVNTNTILKKLFAKNTLFNS
jgi:hypothetical protein